MGDLNADPLTNPGRKLKSFCRSNILTVHIKEATRISDRISFTCLGLIITNIPNFVKAATALPPVASNDHCSVAASLLFRHKNNNSFQRFIWLYDNGKF